MNKMIRNLIFVGVAVLLIVAGYVLMTNTQNQQEENQIIDTPEEDAIVLSEYSTEDVLGVSMLYEGITTTLYYDKLNDLYKVKGYEELSIDQITAKDLAETFGYVEAVSVIRDDLTNLADFGLENPVAKITATYIDGNQTVFYLGNKAPGSSTYYMLVDGIDKIVNVKSSCGLNAKLTILELLEVEDENIIVDEASHIVLKKEGETYLEFMAIDEENATGASMWELVMPYNKSLNSNSNDKSFSELTYIIESLAPYKVLSVDGDVDLYGLLNPTAEVLVEKDNGEIINISFGNDDNGYTPMKYGDSDIIYNIATSRLGFLDYQAIDVIERLLSPISVSKVTEIRMSGIVGDNVLQIEHPAKLDCDGNTQVDTNGNIVYDTLYIVDGKQLEEEKKGQGSWFYQALIKPTIVRESEERDYKPEDKVGEVQYILNNEMATYTISFYEYDDYFYAVQIQDNKVLLLVNKEEINEISEFYELLEIGEMTDPFIN